MTSRRYTMLGALVALTIAQPAAAQQWKGRGRVQGTVTDEQGTPIEGAKVLMSYAESGGGPTLTTSEKGAWAAGGLRGGGWNIDIEATGYIAKKLSVSLQEQGAGPRVEAKMQRAQPPEPAKPSVAEQRSDELKARLKAGDDHLQAGEYALARAEYERVAKELPEVLEIQRAIAYCDYKEGNLEAAVTKLEEIVGQAPEHSEYTLLLANILLEKGDLDRALSYLGKVDDSKVTDSATFLNIAILFLNKARAEDAQRYLDKVIERSPQQGEAYYYRGLACLQLTQNAAAKADFQKYLELAPDATQAASVREILKSLK